MGIYQSLFIHSPGDGHLYYFQFGVLRNKAALDIRAQVFESAYAFAFPWGDTWERNGWVIGEVYV